MTYGNQIRLINEDDNKMDTIGDEIYDLCNKIVNKTDNKFIKTHRKVKSDSPLHFFEEDEIKHIDKEILDE